MHARDFDVFVGCRHPEGRDVASALAAGLAGRGFRVYWDGVGRSLPKGAPDRDGVIAATPDYVCVLTPGVFADDPAGRDCRREVEQALRMGRNVVCVEGPGPAVPLPEEWSSRLHGQRVTFDPARLKESIALVAHRLSSDSSVDDRRVMRLAKRVFAAAALILVAGIALQEIPRLVERWSRPTLLAPVPPFALYWSAVAQRLEGGGWVAVPLQKGTAVRPGDQIRVSFAPSEDGYAYVVSRDPQGNVSVLFPTDAISGASRVRAGVLYEAPFGGGWLTVDDQGIDTICLIAGYDPLQNLEELSEESDARTTAAARRELLESTLHGLLDGRHGAAERRLWTGKLHPIDQALPPRTVARKTSPVALNGGRVFDQPLAAQRGLVSASVELRLQFVPR